MFFRIQIIHGDMALRNCLIDVQAWHCAISDLGLARREGTEPVSNTLAVRWSAPELLSEQSANVGGHRYTQVRPITSFIYQTFLCCLFFLKDRYLFKKSGLPFFQKVSKNFLRDTTRFRYIN
jgi:serine/threonine protein kinase